MNVVFFVESYYHKPLMNGVCVKKVADKLVECGHDVTVFSSSENVYDLPKEDVVDGVHVFWMRRDLRTFLRLFLETHKDKPYRLLKLFQRCYHLWVHLIHSQCWPLKSGLTPIRYFFRANKYLKNKKVDTIVGTYLHIEEVLAAIFLKMRHPEATLITYTLDAMTGRETPKLLGNEKFARRSIAKWEKYVFAKSDKICVMESHRAHYQSGLYDEEILKKIRYVDVPLFNACEFHRNPASQIAVRDTGRRKRIVYTGTSSRATGSAKYLIELLAHIEDAELHLYGRIDDEIREAMHNSGLQEERIFFHGFVDYSEINGILMEADFLATFGSKNACMVSGKVFEYMATQKPILAFYQIDEDVNIVNLSKYPRALMIKEYSRDIQEDVEALEMFLRKSDFEEVDLEYLKKQFFKNDPEAMVQEIVSQHENYTK